MEGKPNTKKPALRIIPGGQAPAPKAPAAPQAAVPETPQAEAKPRPKSNLGKFFTAYADSIDRDVKLLLDL